MTDNEDPSQIAPDVHRDKYVCPHNNCRAFAHHISGHLYLRFPGEQNFAQEGAWTVHRCIACNELLLWRFRPPSGFELVYPLRTAIGARANRDMPEAVREIYDEAREVAPMSSRSAGALLRLALQLLVDDLEPGSDNLDTKIGKLVKKGLLPQTQQAMDVLRVIGNNAVHPGQIDLDDDPDLVPKLFDLVNHVVEQMISGPKHANALFDSLPDGAKAHVARRDGSQPNN